LSANLSEILVLIKFMKNFYLPTIPKNTAYSQVYYISYLVKFCSTEGARINLLGSQKVTTLA
jgi:hypothetical protein